MKTRFAFAVLVFAATLGAVTARAHITQKQPSHVFIYPRRDTLTVVVTGDRNDLTDAVSPRAHQKGAFSKQSLEDKAKSYVETHLFFEQGGQVLPLHAQSVRFFEVPDFEENGQGFEVFLRAKRPVKSAITPLSIASDLFSGLGNARTSVAIGDEKRSIVGKAIVEIPAITTVSTFGSDARDFAWSGIEQPLQIGHLLLLTTLFVGASLGSLRQAVGMLATGFAGMGLSCLLDLTGYLHAPTIWSSGGVALCVAVAGASSCWNAWRVPHSPVAFWALSSLSLLGGAFAGLSFSAPLRVWGLPESGLIGCGLTLVAGAAATQALLALVLWLLLSYWKHKFTHQAQYGGTDWPRAVQIASLGCAALGGLYAAQGGIG